MNIKYNKLIGSIIAFLLIILGLANSEQAFSAAYFVDSQLQPQNIVTKMQESKGRLFHLDPNDNLMDTLSSIEIEGMVESITSEHLAGQPINSYARIRVDRVIEGILTDDYITIRYLGGTVNGLTLRVSHEPVLYAQMQLQVTLMPDSYGKFRIQNPETDLIVRSAGLQPSFATHEYWDQSDIPVIMEINPNTADIAGNGEGIAILNAMDVWNGTTSSSFEFWGQNSSACTPNTNTTDGTNCISWASGPAGPGSTALATTFWWYLSGLMVEADMIFWENNSNGAIDWNANPNSVQFDLNYVARHELGHVLGLAHSAVAGAVMEPTVGSGPQRQCLHQDDIDGIRSLYPSSFAEIWVDLNSSSPYDGTQAHPFATIIDGTNAIGDDGTVWIASGNYDETLFLCGSMTLSVDGAGIVIIGQ